MTEHHAVPAATASPFLPGTQLQFVWDSTSLGWLKACPRKYEYSMIRGLRYRGTTSAHLTFGSHYHAGLELYDKLLASGECDHESAVREVVLQALRWTWEQAACEACNGTGEMGGDIPPTCACFECNGTGHNLVGTPWSSDHPTKTRENLIRSLVWYLEEFGPNDNTKTVILANGKPAVELTFKFDSGIAIGDKLRTEAYNFRAASDPDGLAESGIPETYILSGHLDRLATFGDDTYIADRKTAGSALTAHWFDGFNPSTQMSLYTIAGQVVYGLPIKGVMIDGAQIAVGFTRYGRGFSFRTPNLNQEYLDDLAFWLRAAETYAAAGRWPKNEEACGNYGGCPFRRICSRDPSVRESVIKSDFEVKRWNPLQERV